MGEWGVILLLEEKCIPWCQNHTAVYKRDVVQRSQDSLKQSWLYRSQRASARMGPSANLCDAYSSVMDESDSRG